MIVDQNVVKDSRNKDDGLLLDPITLLLVRLYFAVLLRQPVVLSSYFFVIFVHVPHTAPIIAKQRG